MNNPFVRPEAVLRVISFSTKLACCVLLFFLLSLSGCARNKNLAPPPKPMPPITEMPSLVLGPGDVLDIKFRYAEELDDKQTIRPDGKITLQMVDEVQAAGLTPMELDKQLTELYTKYLKDPVISVVVREMVSQRVYVGGEVNKPGEVPLAGQLTALQAIMASGGFDKMSAEPGSVLIIRHQQGQRSVFRLDLSDALKTGAEDPFYLMAKDIVYVPRTRIEEVNLWVDKYINRLIPQGFTYAEQLSAKRSVGYTPAYGRR